MRLGLRLPRLRDRDAEHRITHEIEELLTLIAVDPGADDHALLARLLQAGIGRTSAMRLVVLVPTAFGRDLASRRGIRLDPNVEILNQDGSARTIRRLDSFPEFRVAVSLVPRLRETTAYIPLATRSAEGNAVEALQQKGVSDMSGAALTASLVTWDIL